MTKNDSAATILYNRFIQEQEYVETYVNFVQQASSVSEKEVRTILDILRKHDICNIRTSNKWKRWRTPYKHEELKEVYRQIQEVRPLINQTMRKAEEELITLSEPEESTSLDALLFVNESIQYIVKNTNSAMSSRDIARRSNELMEQIKSHNFSIGDFNAEALHDDVTAYIVDNATYWIVRRKLDELDHLQSQIYELEFLMTVGDPNATINLLRQGFINLVTIFEATIFDLMRLALKKNFFGLIGLFGEKEKLSLQQLSKYKSFDELQTDVIEEQLKSKYLKEMLNILKKLNMQLVDKNEGHRFAHLLELVQRRNIHIHNRGMVDNKYLEQENGVPKYNIYNYSLGDAANIDESYWETANTLCRNCVLAVSAWVDSL